VERRTHRLEAVTRRLHIAGERLDDEIQHVETDDGETSTTWIQNQIIDTLSGWQVRDWRDQSCHSQATKTGSAGKTCNNARQLDDLIEFVTKGNDVQRDDLAHKQRNDR